MEKNTRNVWLAYMLDIVTPVLKHLSTGTLHEAIPTNFHSGKRFVKGDLSDVFSIEHKIAAH